MLYGMMVAVDSSSLQGVSISFGCQIVWNYFAIGHGKGEVDGARTLLKREVCKEQIKPKC